VTDALPSNESGHGPDVAELIAEVASRFVAVVVEIDDDAWAGPGLGDWSVRELVGHTIRAFSTVDRFLDHPLDAVTVADAAEYYRVALSASPDIHTQVAQRGQEAGAALGDDPASAVVDQVASTLGRLAETSGDEVGMTAAGGMRLADYLDTRLVELVVHLSDLCAALGRPAPDLGVAGVRVASTVYASAGPDDRDAVLRSMLGRLRLPPGFNVWP